MSFSFVLSLHNCEDSVLPLEIVPLCEYNCSCNGYLLDEKLIEKAVGQWKLKNVQITLDGTEKNYNERKACVDISGSAFQKVINNIDLLLNAGIAVQIRLNVDTENANDLSVLSDQLKERFGERENLSVYAVALFDNEDLMSGFERAKGSAAG